MEINLSITISVQSILNESLCKFINIKARIKINTAARLDHYKKY